MAHKSFLPAIRELARAYQAMESYSSRMIRVTGLTPSQFDVVATLGNTIGMNCRELGEKTLITKGTLTGVLDRLEAKNLVRRVTLTSDKRSNTVQLTQEGEALFAKIFPEHLEYIGRAFAAVSGEELDHAESVLRRLREIFSATGEA